MKRLILLVCLTALILSGCSTINYGGAGKAERGAVWAVIPFVNSTETPFAAERAEAIATAVLYANGIRKVLAPPQEPAADGETVSADRGIKRRQDGLEWAKKQGARYALTGTVTEWRYKVGLDGEPVAGMTIQLVDLSDSSVLWSGSSGRSGWSREAVSAVAQQVIEKLVSAIPVSGN